MNYAKIGRYQFENLVAQQVPFLLLDIGGKARRQDKLKSIFSQSHAVLSFLELGELVNNFKLEKDYPLVLCCPDGQLSEKFAQSLSDLGHLNVYVVDGGHASLLE